jgi:hypothetical protein
MKRWTLFLGLILILIGLLLLLDILGLLGGIDAGTLIWSLVFIGVGFGILWGVITGRSMGRVEEVTIPLDGAERAQVLMRHGAGHLRVGPGGGADALLEGSFGGGLDYRATRDGSALRVDMRPPVRDPFAFGLPWMIGQGRALDWHVALTPDVPLALELQTGAGEAVLDLGGLLVTDVWLKTGASATKLIAPAGVDRAHIKVEGGAASVSVRIPPGVAARIRATGGLAGISVDETRFPRQGGVYQSPDYETAAHIVDVEVDMGVGSIDIR